MTSSHCVTAATLEHITATVRTYNDQRDPGYVRRIIKGCAVNGLGMDTAAAILEQKMSLHDLHQDLDKHLNELGIELTEIAASHDQAEQKESLVRIDLTHGRAFLEYLSIIANESFGESIADALCQVMEDFGEHLVGLYHLMDEDVRANDLINEIGEIAAFFVSHKHSQTHPTAMRMKARFLFSCHRAARHRHLDEFITAAHADMLGGADATTCGPSQWHRNNTWRELDEMWSDVTEKLEGMAKNPHASNLARWARFSLLASIRGSRYDLEMECSGHERDDMLTVLEYHEKMIERLAI